MSDCIEHVWLLDGVTLADGSFTEYVCTRCGADLLVPPGGVHPQTL